MSTNYKPRKFKNPAPERIYTPAELKVKADIEARTARKLYNHVDRAYFHRERSEAVGELLRDAVEAAAGWLDQEQFDELMALSKRIKYCSERENHYIAGELHSQQTGETFDGNGHLYPCAHKFCHSCVATYAKRNHKTAAAAISEIALLKRKYKDFTKEGRPEMERKERLRTITLTMPPIVASCVDSLKIILAAFEKLRKTDLFRNYISGFARDAEFTVRSDGTYHAHIHLIVAGMYLPDFEFKAQWTKCVEAVFNKAGIEFQPGTKSGYLNVHFGYVNNLEKATKELCKYITKSDSWSEVPKSHLLEIASVARWPKMFALGGTFAVAAARLKRQQREARAAELARHADNAERKGYVHTKSVSGRSSEDGTSVETLESMEATKVQPKRFKKPNWRTLVREVGLAKYEIILEEQVKRQREYRKQQLKQKYPLATFTDLTGKVWARPYTEFVEEIAPEAEAEWNEAHKMKLL
jgi:hypothetical protein